LIRVTDADQTIKRAQGRDESEQQQKGWNQMSILSSSGYGFGLASFFKGLAGGESTAGRGGTAAGVATPARFRGHANVETRFRAAAVSHVREAERVEEDAERWDGLA
jgi:hypothetical protein